jgi:chromosome segregation ATPase
MSVVQINRLEVELEALKRGKSEEEIETELEAKEKIVTKIASLNTSFDKMKEQADVLQKDVDELENDSSSKANADKLKGKKESLSMAVAKVGAVLESLEGQLKDKLTLANVKMEDCSAQFKWVREELRLAKEVVTQVQAAIIGCQKRLKEVRLQWCGVTHVVRCYHVQY